MNWETALGAYGLSIATMLVGGAMAWQKVKDHGEENKRRLTLVEERLDCLEELGTKLAVLTNEIGWINRELARRGNGHDRKGRHDDS